MIDNDIPNELEKELSKNEIFKKYDNFMRTILLTDFENLNKPLYKELQTRAKSFLPKRKFYAAGTEI